MHAAATVLRRRGLAAAALALPLLMAGCRKVDPRQVVALSDVETYWAVDRPVGGTQFLAPVVRFRLANTSSEPLRAVDASATFRRKDEAPMRRPPTLIGSLALPYPRRAADLA